MPLVWVQIVHCHKSSTHSQVLCNRNKWNNVGGRWLSSFLQVYLCQQKLFLHACPDKSICNRWHRLSKLRVIFSNTHAHRSLLAREPSLKVLYPNFKTGFKTSFSICSESIPHCTVQTCHVPPLKLRQGDTACFEAAATDEISGGNEWVFQPPWLTRLDGVPRQRWETGAKNIVLENQSPLKCSFNWHNKARITAGPPFRLLLVA